jgi:hypothetical protein
MKKTVFLIGILLLLVACGFPAVRSVPTSTPIPSPTNTEIPTPTATPTLEPTPAFTSSPTSTQEPVTENTLAPVGVCDPNEVIESLNKIVPYKEFVLTYNTLDGARFLVYWIVDPELNSVAEVNDLDSNFNEAVWDAIKFAHKLNRADPCVSKLFTDFNPVVVDGHHNGWFSGLFDVKQFPSVDTLTDSDAQRIAASTKQGWKRTTVPDIKEIPSTSCTWSEASTKISRHFYTSPLNKSFLVADNNGVTVTVNFASTNTDNIKIIKAEEMVAFLNAGREIGCLKPPVKSIVVLLMDKDGYVLNADRFPMDSYPLKNQEEGSQGG